MSILPVASRSAYLTKVDLRVKVGCKRISVVSSVAVQNINSINLVKLMLNAYAQYACVTPGSKPQPRSAVSPASSNFFDMPTARIIKNAENQLLLQRFS